MAENILHWDSRLLWASTLHCLELKCKSTFWLPIGLCSFAFSSVPIVCRWGWSDDVHCCRNLHLPVIVPQRPLLCTYLRKAICLPLELQAHYLSSSHQISEMPQFISLIMKTLPDTVFCHSHHLQTYCGFPVLWVIILYTAHWSRRPQSPNPLQLAAHEKARAALVPMFSIGLWALDVHVFLLPKLILIYERVFCVQTWFIAYFYMGAGILFLLAGIVSASATLHCLVAPLI